MTIGKMFLAIFTFYQIQASDSVQKQLVFVGILLLAIIGLLLTLLVLHHRSNLKLKEQLRLLNEERQRTQDALAIRKAFVNTINEQIKGPIGVLLHYARVFNMPGFRINPMNRPKTFTDILKAAREIDSMLDPILDSYINKSKGITLEQKQRCQEALRSPLHGLISLTVAISAHELILFSATDEHSKQAHADKVPLNETMRAMLDSYDMRNRLLTKTFKTKISDDVTIETDLAMLKEILYMLINNADKYATEGELTVSTQQERDGRYSVYVQNIGSTIPKEELPNAFMPFSHILHQKAGLGLGLALARKLGKSLDYQVNLDLTYTKGTRSVVTGL